MIRALDRWLPAYFARSRRRPVPSAQSPCHVFLAVCDHFEPFHDTDKAGAMRAMADWEQAWPCIVDSFRDSSDRGPRHTFFFPIEQYDQEVLERLAAICARTGSEVEVHLHHKNDTAGTLRQKLLLGISQLAGHGLLSRSKNGLPNYGFIHGNWALDHSHPAGLHCGVPDELNVLLETGCYADFTFPSAPDPSQPPIINSIYRACEDGRSCSHHHGRHVEAGVVNEDGLLLVQGPLGLSWKRRKWGLFPRLENADLTGVNPPTMERFRLWMELAPHIRNGPPWLFVKLHTHGGISRNYRTLLGQPALDFYSSLSTEASSLSGFRYHFVTAREMVNLIYAVESGVSSDERPEVYFDHSLPKPPLHHG